MKKNNLFKISLVLLVSNLSNIHSNPEHYMESQLIEAEKEAATYNNDPEVRACRDGVKARNRSGSSQLLTSFEDIANIAKAKPNPNLIDELPKKAAWIFGYNQNMTGAIKNGLSYTYDNAWSTGNMFHMPADPNFGGKWENNNYLGPIEVCEYGQ